MGYHMYMIILAILVCGPKLVCNTKSYNTGIVKIYKITNIKNINKVNL